MKIAFILLILAVAVIVMFEYKKKGYSVPISILLGVVFILCGFVVMLIKLKNGTNSQYNYSLYDSIGGVAVELCVAFIPAILIDYLITKRIVKPVNKHTSWICSKCGHRNSCNDKKCVCGFVKDQTCKEVSDTWKCPNCGQENPYTMNVCDCGTKKPEE